MKQQTPARDNGVAVHADEKKIGVGARRVCAHHEGVSIADFCDEVLVGQKGKRAVNRKHPNRTPKRALDRRPDFISAQGLLCPPYRLQNMSSNIGQAHPARFTPRRYFIERDIKGALRVGFDRWETVAMSHR